MQRLTRISSCGIRTLAFVFALAPLIAHAQAYPGTAGDEPQYPGIGPSKGKLEGTIGSYNLRFYGTVLLNTAFSDTPTISNDVPLWATPSNVRVVFDDGTSERVDDVQGLIFTARQSVFGFIVKPTTTGDWQTAGKLEFDFFGTRPSDVNLPQGRVFNEARLRFAYFQFGKNDWKVTAGQDKAILAPLDPVSLSHVAIPAASDAGNLWAWLPQVRVDYTRMLGTTAALFQFGVLRPQFGDPRLLDSPPPSGTSVEGNPGLGELAGQPFYQARFAISRPLGNANLNLGASGHYGRERVGTNRTQDSWAFAIDYTVPIAEQFTWRGELFMGSNLAPFQGGILQGVAWPGPPSTNFRKIGAAGGWTELIFEANEKDVFYGGIGIDDPRDQNFLTGTTRSRNSLAWVSYFRKLNDNITLAIEWSNWQLKTRNIVGGVAGPQGPSGTANVFNAAFAYQF